MTQTFTNQYVLYAGKFQPFTAEHFEVYTQLKNRFPAGNVIIVTSNSDKRDFDNPLTFDEKKKIMVEAWKIPENNILGCAVLYGPAEFLDEFLDAFHLDPTTTTVLYAGRQKDADRLTKSKYKADGTLRFIQEYKPNMLVESVDKHAYSIVVSNVTDANLHTDGFLKSVMASPDIDTEDKKIVFRETLNNYFDYRIFEQFLALDPTWSPF